MKRLFTIGAVVLLGLIAGGSHVQASENAAPAAEAPKGRSVAEFISPDGRFDLDAARRSGYQGPLDIEGFQSAIDSATGWPVFHPSGTDSTADDPNDVYWDNSLSPFIIGYESTVRVAAVYDERLIVSVYSSSVGDFVYAWDGTSWSLLRFINGPVRSLTVYNGKLIAGGCFTVAGDAIAYCIASWDGTSWSPLESGLNGCVHALTVYDGKLIAGGEFTTTVGGVAANSIASWDGSSWSPLGTGTDGQVWSLTVYDGKLIAGGGVLNGRWCRGELCSVLGWE